MAHIIGNRIGYIILVLSLAASSLACLGSVGQASEAELRGWTMTPTSSPIPEPSKTPTPSWTQTPAIIFITATPFLRDAEVITEALEVRKEASESSESVGFVSKGDVVTIAWCQVDENNDTWAYLTYPIEGWAAVTWGNKIFIKPLPRC